MFTKGIRNRIVFAFLVFVILGPSCRKKLPSSPDTFLDLGEGSRYQQRFDLRDQNIMTPVKNQGLCGACWAFSTVGLLEALIKNAIGLETDLSEQHIINCMPTGGCLGGSIMDALRYLVNSGVCYEIDEPYVALVDNCNPQNQSEYFLSDYTSLSLSTSPPFDRVETIKNTLLQYGPVVAEFSYSPDFGNYSSGVYIHDGISGFTGTHIVILTGWANDQTIKNGGYWICKNSEGPDWGEQGYFRIAYEEAQIGSLQLCYGIFTSNSSKGRIPRAGPWKNN